MKRLIAIFAFVALAVSCAPQAEQAENLLPWDNGKLCVSENGRFLQHENGTPFFWLGETGWLLPERLTREEADFYLDACRDAGYNVVQVQTINGVPATNAYGKREVHTVYAKTREECERLLDEMIPKVRAEIKAEKKRIKEEQAAQE